MMVTDRFHCPLRACRWQYEAVHPDRLTVAPDDAALAECEGDWLAAATLVTFRAYHWQIDAAIREHVKTHDVVDFMREIQALKTELSAATGSVIV